MTVYQIIYRSAAKEGFEVDEIKQILEKSRKNNLELDVTGMLIFNNGAFLQFLEGDKQQVEQLYEKISKDPRHVDISVIWSGDVAEKSFSRWSMNFKDLAQEDEVFLQEYRESIKDIFNFTKTMTEPTAGYKLFMSLKDSI